MFSIDILKYRVGVDISTESIGGAREHNRKNIYLPIFNSKVYFPLFRSFEGIGMFKEFGHHIVQSSVLNSSEVDKWDHIYSYLTFSDFEFGGMRACFDRYAAGGSWSYCKYIISDFFVLLRSMEVYCHYGSWVIEVENFYDSWYKWYK